MSKDLFFLPLIADALQKPDANKALQEALEEIERLGQQPQYKRGFRQFMLFMTEVQQNIEDRPSLSEDPGFDSLRDLQLQIIAGALEKSSDEQVCLDLINSRPDWKREFDKLRAEAAKAAPPERAPRIVIDKNGEEFETISFERRPLIRTIKNVRPGMYEFRLENGRVLGEKQLTRDDLLWVYAYPKEDLKLAADTGDTLERPTRGIELLDGEVIIRVFPGIESGHLEIEIRG